jgi:hypothetical protein
MACASTLSFLEGWVWQIETYCGRLAMEQAISWDLFTPLLRF